MMIRSIGVLLIIFTCLVVMHCDDIIVEDISNHSVNLLAPENNAAIIGDSVTFWWDYVEEAEQYNLRLASPSLSNPQFVIADSLVSVNLISFNLPPGSYEWEVSALNNAYQTDFFYRSFTLDSLGGQDISDLQVQLIAPVNGSAIIGSSVTLWWEDLPAEAQYEVTLISPSFENPVLVVTDTVVAANKITIDLDPGSYEWAVNGVNGDSKTPQASRTFSIDSVEQLDLSETLPEVIAPANDASLIASEVDITWEAMEGALDYELRIVSPSFENITEVLLDTVTALTALEKALNPGQYAFRLKARNSNSESQETIINFDIDSILVTDISQASIKLNTPGFGTIPSGQMTFWWDDLDGATSYDLRIVSPDFEDPDVLVFQLSTEENEVTIPLDSGNYEWGVQAFNRDYSTERFIRPLKVD